jgi:hypothetical protein
MVALESTQRFPSLTPYPADPDAWLSGRAAPQAVHGSGPKTGRSQINNEGPV